MSGDRQLSPSTVVSVDGQLITVDVKKRGTFDGPNKPPYKSHMR